MFNSETARAKALNLQAIEYHLTKTTSAAYIADELDCVIFNYLTVIRHDDDENLITKREIADDVYNLVRLRNLFIYTAISNNEQLNFDRIKVEFD